MFIFPGCIFNLYKLLYIQQIKKGTAQAARYKGMKEAIKKLESKGYFVENQFDGFTSTLSDQYELYKGDEFVMAYLSEAQVIALSNIL